MKIALGCDHRGGKIIGKLIRDVFSRDHYIEGGTERANDLQLGEEPIGAFLINNATISDEFNEKEEEPTSIELIGYSQNETPPRIYSPNESVDYPDVAAAVAEAVATGRADRGVLVCGTGIGMCIVANKFRGVRAALCFNSIAAELSRRHNDANILCLSGEYLSFAAIESMVRLWLTTPFDGGRHAKRLEKIAKIEAGLYNDEIERLTKLYIENK